MKAGRVRCTRGRRLVPHYRGSLSPGKGGAIMVTYSELFAYSLVLLGVATLFYQIGKHIGKRK